jgi:hypothetical protein
MVHPLHEAIGKTLKTIELNKTTQIYCDPACNGDQNIPLFVNDTKSNSTECCNVDILFVKDGKAKVIIEIEEANITPTQICGKLLTSAIAKQHIHKNSGNVPFGDSTVFIQIVDTSRLKIDTKKDKQLILIEKALKALLPICHIMEYCLIQVNGSPDTAELSRVKECVLKALALSAEPGLSQNNII